MPCANQNFTRHLIIFVNMYGVDPNPNSNTAKVKYLVFPSITHEKPKYRKIPNVSPGLIEVFKHFLGGLYSGGLIFGGAYIRRAFCVSVRV